VLAATNMPWLIDDAARRRFVLRQYIPLPAAETRLVQLLSLLRKQLHTLSETELVELVELTEGTPREKTC
jgi:fidgetin-like protein 1